MTAVAEASPAPSTRNPPPRRGRGRFRHAWGAFVVAILVHAIPGGAGAQEPGSFPSEPPEPLSGTSLEFPAFEEFTLENGLRVALVSYGTQPVMSARLYVPGGSTAEPSELAGLATLAAGVLTQGTTTRSSEQISDRIEGVGGNLTASAGQDFFSVSVSALVEHADLALEMLADVARNATLPEEEVELARTRVLSQLQAELGRPQAIAARRSAAVIYGSDHPYGVAAIPETIERITREDIVTFRDRLLQPDGALLLVAGRIERPRVEALVRTHLGDWEGAGSALPQLPSPPERDRARIHLVHRPGSVQSVVSVGHLGITADSPDYFPVLVMNRVLGGGSTSRLFRILREERGWTYGAYSRFTFPAGRGRFEAQAEVRTEVTDSTVVEVLDQLRRLRDEPVPQDELEAARSYLAGSFPLRLETASQVAGQLAPTLLLGLPVEHVTQYPARVRNVATGDVRLAARDHIHPDRVAIVVVGDAGQLLEPLEAIAPVDLFTVDGTPLSRSELQAAAPPARWDAERLEAGQRTYDVLVEDQSVGSAEYRLARDGTEWLSTVVVHSMGSSQQTDLRFSAEDFTPLLVRQETTQGAIRISADLRVEDGRLVGRMELPEELGGDREFDRPLEPGTLLPGMDEYALAAASLGPDARFQIPYLNLMSGEMVELDVRVQGEEEITVPAGTFSTWRTEVTGGDAPLTLFLRQEPPHLLVRQAFTGQPIRFDLVSDTSP